MSAEDESKAKALSARFQDIKAMRPGETEDDSRRRRIFTSWTLNVDSIGRYRDRAREAHEMLEAHGISTDDQIVIIRQVLPAWASWVAAEVVHGRKSAEHMVGDVYSTVRSIVLDE